MGSGAQQPFALLCHCLALFVSTSGSGGFSGALSPYGASAQNTNQLAATAASALSCQGDWQLVPTAAS